MFWFDFNWQIQNLLNQHFALVNISLLVILLIVAYLGYKKPIYAAGLTIILLPSYLIRSAIWFIPVTFLELSIWAALGGFLIKKIVDKKKSPGKSKTKVLKIGEKIKLYRLPVVLILAAATISVFVSSDALAAAGLWKAYFVEPILFFVFLLTVMKNKKDRETILWALGISTLLVSLLAIYQKITGFAIGQPDFLAEETRRVTSIFTSPNSVGLYLAPIFVIYLGWLAQKAEMPPTGSKTKMVAAKAGKIAILILAGLAMLFTISQGTWAGLVMALIFISFFGWNKKMTVTILLLIIGMTSLMPLAREKILPIITLADPAGQNRLVLWQMSFDHLFSSSTNFTFGAGLFGFSEIQNQRRNVLKMEPLLYPHNIFLNFWLELGILGLFAFGWLIKKFFVLGFKKLGENAERILVLSIMAAMFGLIVHGLVDVPYFKNDLAVLFWIIIALI